MPVAAASASACPSAISVWLTNLANSGKALDRENARQPWSETSTRAIPGYAGLVNGSSRHSSSNAAPLSSAS